MYISLAEKNLKTQSQRTMLTVAGIAIAIAALTILTAFNTGLKNAVFAGAVEANDLQDAESNLQIVSTALSGISLIILVIAGLAIANTFFSSVRERQQEIGLLRALGATQMDIQKMFLAEAALIGLAGGIIGIVTGVLFSLLLDSSILRALPEMAAKPNTIIAFDFGTLFFTLIFAIGLSIVFAFFPSSKAARLNPLETLNAS